MSDKGKMLTKKHCLSCRALGTTGKCRLKYKNKPYILGDRRIGSKPIDPCPKPLTHAMYKFLKKKGKK